MIHTSRWKISASQIQNLNFKFLVTGFILISAIIFSSEFYRYILLAKQIIKRGQIVTKYRENMSWTVKNQQISRKPPCSYEIEDWAWFIPFGIILNNFQSWFYSAIDKIPGIQPKHE